MWRHLLNQLIYGGQQPVRTLESSTFARMLRISENACETLFIMAAVWNRADHYIFALWFLMVALCNRADHYIFILFLSSSFFFLLFFLA